MLTTHTIVAFYCIHASNHTDLIELGMCKQILWLNPYYTKINSKSPVDFIYFWNTMVNFDLQNYAEKDSPNSNSTEASVALIIRIGMYQP